ncbi:MAG: nucleotidyltransferase family protein [Bacteroidales bacterium]|nr:nucleotidyltransferase family protein [Bacteroidales bacterium]
MEAMIFAAGLGTRLYPLTANKPKALVEVNGISLLERNIVKLISYGVKRIVVNVHHFPDMIIDFLNSKNFPCKVLVSDERDELLNTGGGLIKAQNLFSKQEDILVHNVDILSDIDFSKLLAKHKENNSIATLAVRDRETSRYLLFNRDGILSGWENKSTKEQIIKREGESLESLAFSGIQIVSPEIFEKNKLSGTFSMIDLYLSLAKENNISSFIHNDNRWIDVGKQTSVEKAEEMFEN